MVKLSSPAPSWRPTGAVSCAFHLVSLNSNSRSQSTVFLNFSVQTCCSHYLVRKLSTRALSRHPTGWVQEQTPNCSQLQFVVHWKHKIYIDINIFNIFMAKTGLKLWWWWLSSPVLLSIYRVLAISDYVHTKTTKLHREWCLWFLIWLNSGNKA